MENNTEKEVVYIAELDADVDDVVAAEYLHNKGVLKCVVLDPLPKTEQGKNRERDLEKLGITICTKIPPVAKYVFIGGALTEVAQYIKTRHIDVLVMNGGFVGSNIVSYDNQLDKFKDKDAVRTFNFNCDVEAASAVLRSTERQIGKILLIGKNVCHSIINSELGIWNDPESKKLFKKYNVKEDKRQHDMLACHEGLAYLGLGDVTVPYTVFNIVRPFNKGLKDNMTEWGSLKEAEKSPYRTVVASVCYPDTIKEKYKNVKEPKKDNNKRRNNNKK